MSESNLKSIAGKLAGPWGCMLALGLFWVGILRDVELPGLYMDAINPDYLVARILHPALSNPVWVMPGPPLPLLGNLYHGTQTMLLGLLTYGVLGMSVASARVSQALFGAAIVVLAWLILRRATRRPLLATLVAVALASDMGFLGSFRTQAYIILSGQAWMMLSLYMAIRACEPQASFPKAPLLSGVFMGLAVYGYFVFLFFLPPIALLAGFGAGRQDWRGRTRLWLLGFVCGMLPYLIGYLWLMIDVGGPMAFVDWMRTALTGLKPTEGSASYLAGLANALQNARMGLAGAGNEIMMVGAPVSPAFMTLREGITLVAIVVCGVGAWVDRVRAPFTARILAAAAALPVVYVLAAAWFGSRLWVHHFTVLVAVEYVLIGLAAAWFAQRYAHLRWPGYVGAALALVLLVTNGVQQHLVHSELKRTGGVGMSSDAMTAMARTALTEQDRTVWFFPDWGFFMPFIFLTSNQVPYEIELTDKALSRHLDDGKDLRVAFWKRDDGRTYRDLLERHGVGDIHLYQFDRRDGQPAFYVIGGRVGGDAGGSARSP